MPVSEDTAKKEYVEELEERIHRLEKKLEEREENSRSPEDSGEISRREFLKGLGAGAAGLGALAMLPTAAANVKITDTGITKNGVSNFWTDGSTGLDDGSSGSPSLNFNSDTDTGIYRPAANTVGVAGDLEVNGARTESSWYNKSESGTVVNGDAGTVFITELADGETFSVTQCALTNADGTAAATDCDLIIADLTNGVSEVTLIDSDGVVVNDDVTGSPVGSYTNSSGGTEQVGVLVDNGHFNAGSGSDQDVAASFIARVS